MKEFIKQTRDFDLLLMQRYGETERFMMYKSLVTRLTVVCLKKLGFGYSLHRSF